MSEFTSQRVMITGAAGGIGIGLVTYFLDRGATVLALDLDNQGLARLTSDLGDPGRLHTAVVDLTDGPQVRAVVQLFENAQGAVTTLVNNAGAAAATALSNMTPEAWAHDLNINLTSAYNCVEAVKERMFAGRRGVIINVGTVNGMLALGHPAYSAAKAGLISYTRSLAIEYGPLGVRANIVCPGTVRTQAWNARAEKNPEIFGSLQKWYPLRDFPTPADIANAVGFLASDAARMITGVVLPVDAGLTAGNPVMAGELTLERF